MLQSNRFDASTTFFWCTLARGLTWRAFDSVIRVFVERRCLHSTRMLIDCEHRTRQTAHKYNNSDGSPKCSCQHVFTRRHFFRATFLSKSLAFRMTRGRCRFVCAVTFPLHRRFPMRICRTFGYVTWVD